jgi:hypothetical protein
MTMPENDPQPGEEWSPSHTPTVIVDHTDFRDDGLRRVYYRQHRDMEVLLLDEFLQRFNPPEAVNANVARTVLVREVEQAVTQALGGVSPLRLEEVRGIIHERLEARRLERESRPIAHRVTHRDPYLDGDDLEGDALSPEEHDRLMHSLEEERDYEEHSPPTPEELDSYTDEEMEALAAREENEPYFEDALTVEDYEAFNARLAARAGREPPPTQWDRLTKDEDE